MNVDVNSRQYQRFVLGVLGCVAALTFTLTGQSEPPASVAKPDFSPVREFIKAEMVATNTPSMAVAVARGNEILWEEGFGYIRPSRRDRRDPQTLYYAASVTKAFTASALMILHERKQLDLDRPANRSLTKAKLRSPYWNPEEATVRQVGLQSEAQAFETDRESKRGDCGNYVHSIVWEFAVPARLCPYHGRTGSNRITSCSA